MKIAVLTHLKYPIREPFAGGLEMHTHLLTRRLIAHGHEVVLFAAAGSDPELNIEVVGGGLALIADIANEPSYDTVFFREHHIYLALMTELRRRDFDVVHNNSLHYLPVVMADTLPAPMLTTLHTPPFSLLESALRICPPNGAFVAISEAMRRLWAPIVQMRHIIPNGVDLQHFRYQPQAALPRYLFWHGRIVPEKGLDLAIAAARIAGASLWIAGPVIDTDFFDQAIAPFLDAKIVYLGHLTQVALVPLIAGAAACLFTPRWEEPFGLVIAEALACGTPVAGFARGAAAEILTAASGVLVAPDDVPALAKASQSAALLDRADCRARAVEICDAEAMVCAYEQLYASLVR
jgi:glycosyltransferase involved in cell wall biosynthesis